MTPRFLLIWPACVIWLATAEGDEPRAKKPAKASPVVVELFTSEGCSSCPPADRLFQSLVQEGVIGLGYHVDYWDDLGWPDPHASRQFTDRQNAYVRALKLDQPYTPQMFVNGRTQFVGSNREQADDAIAAERAVPFEHKLVISLASTTPEAIVVDYAVEGLIDGEHVVAALVQRTAQTDVPRGENANRKLSHANLVRVLTNADLTTTPKGSLTVKIPAELKLAGCHLTVFVQSPKSGRITGATELSLQPQKESPR